MTEEFRVGVISSVHGIRGEAKVFITSDDPERFRNLKTVTGRFPKSGTVLRPGNAGVERVLELQSVRFSNGMAICKFRGIDTPEDMQKLRGINKEDPFFKMPGQTVRRMSENSSVVPNFN